MTKETIILTAFHKNVLTGVGGIPSEKVEGNL